jgi:uncharacterized membrane protein YhiD involved in acid resistance
MLAVVYGMACGSGYVLAAVAAIPLVLLGSWLFRPRAETTAEPGQLLILRLGTASGAEQKVQALLKERGLSCRLAGLETVRGGAALDFRLAIPPLAANEALSLVADLNRIEGVQGVEWKSEA